MRGTSATSLEAVLAVVDGSQGDAAELGGQLFGVVDAIDQTPALRRVFTDPSTDEHAKRALARSIFADKVGAATAAVIETAVSARWAAGRDLTDGLEQAGVVAYLRSAQDQGSAERFEDELFQAGRTMVEDLALRRAVSDKAAPARLKKNLLADVFGDKITPESLAILQQASVARTGSFEKVLERFSQLVARRRGRLVATVQVAYELDDTERDRLAAVLRRKYGADVQLNVIVDPAVVGGIAVHVGDEVVDATMSTRLEAARRALAG